MSATLVTPKTTSGGEIIRELVNASDGAGLHFDGAAGNIAGTTGLNLGSKYSAEFVLNYSGQSQSRLFDISGGGRVIIEFNRTGYTGKIVGYDSGWYEIADLFENDTTVHFVVTFDGTSVTAYVNGSQVGTATKNNSTEITSSQFAVGSSIPVYGSWFNGTIYRARFYNRTLSADDVRTAYQRADVPVADQYGEQNLVDTAASAFTSGTYSWTAYGSNTIANVSNDLTITYGGNSSGAYNYFRDSSDLNQDLVVGKKYRLRIRAKYAGGTAGVAVQVYDGAASTVADSALTTSFADYEIEFTAQSTTGGFVYLSGLKSSNVVTIDTWQLDEIGAVVDLDLAFANENQSRMVADRSTNNVDGEMSSSGVKQTQVIKQLNSTSARIGTPAATAADGEIISSGKISANAKVNINSNGTLDWGNAADYGVLSWGGTTDAIVRGAASKNLKLGANNQNFVTINTSGNVGVGDSTPTSPGGAARFVEISGTSASLVLTDSDAATWEWISAGGNLKAAKDGSDYLSIDSSGNVNVNGGGYVKIGPADTQAELRLYRDDATINTSGIAIGDINFGGADANNDNAARLRVKSDGAWTSTSSPTAFEFQTCPSGSESLATRLVIASDGNIEQHTDSNGIVKFGVKNESTGTAARAMVNILSDHGNLDLSMNGTNYTGVAGWADSGVVSTGSVVGGGLKLNAVAGGLALQTNQTTRLSIANSTGLATFANDVAYDDNARVYHGNLPSTGPSHSGHDKYNFNFTFSGTYGVALITLDIAAGIGEVAAGRYTLAVSCTANSGVTTQLMGSVTDVFKHNLSALTFADSGSSNRTFTLSVERTVTAENWGTNTGSYKAEVTNNHRTLTLNSVTAST